MAVRNPDGSWAPDDQEIVLAFSADSGQYWEGVVPKATVTTWLIPSPQILGQTNGTTAAGAAPPYPFGNGSLVGSTGSRGMTGSGVVTGTGTGSVACAVRVARRRLPVEVRRA
ncbi:hypothetical protein LTR53_003193 [Teratosphaeriaceae sp. CCFEE 6253]|nr:hypothetical protein LTR53_003193 [Teratosphaeriaceae sp. CCFEE 6253]